MFERLSRAIWLMSYSLEERRQIHASHRNLWRQAGCCIGLSLLRLMGALV